MQWRGRVAKVRGRQPQAATTSLSVTPEGPCADARSKGPTTAPNLMLARPRAAHRSSLAAGAERMMFPPPPTFLLDQGAPTQRATLRLPRDASLTRRDGRRVAFESIPHPRGRRPPVSNVNGRSREASRSSADVVQQQKSAKITKIRKITKITVRSEEI